MDFNQKTNKEIQDLFEKIKKDSGVTPDIDYQQDIMDMFGLNLEEMEEEMYTASKTKTINIEIVHGDAVFPRYAYPSDSGFDLHSTEDLEIGPFGRILVPTGLKVSFEEGYEIQVRPKSGLAIKQGLTVLNTPGTVDQGYTGEIQVIVFNTNNYSVMIPKGMKIAQAVLCPVINGKYVNLQLVNQVEEKDRGNNGFGSTGLGI
jgi:dUTP pyrophosphatase